MPVHLVGHACAGGKTRWAGPDRDRPLDEAGTDEAAALVDVFDSVEPLVGRQRGKIMAMRDDDGWLLRKGTGWELTPNDHGNVVALRHVDPRAMHSGGAHDPLVS